MNDHASDVARVSNLLLLLTAGGSVAATLAIQHLVRVCRLVRMLKAANTIRLRGWARAEAEARQWREAYEGIRKKWALPTRKAGRSQ